MSARASSIQPRSRSHPVSSASCATSTVGAPVGLVTVEREEPLPAQLVDHRLHRHDVDVDREGLRGRAPAADPKSPAQRSSTAGGTAGGPRPAPRGQRWYRSSARLLSTPCAPPTDRPICRKREAVVDASVEELGEGVLEDRERARLANDVLEQLSEHRRFTSDPASRGRFRRQPPHSSSVVNGTTFTTPAPRRSANFPYEGEVVRVGSEREHDEDAAVRVIDRGNEVLQEAPALVFVCDEREQLFELVDHEHES